jgi:hypothetical protein
VSPVGRGPGRGKDAKCTEPSLLDTDYDVDLSMTHDTDVLEPEPARPGGLVRKDLVGLPLFSSKLVADLGAGTTHLSPTGKTSGAPYAASIHSRS